MGDGGLVQDHSGDTIQAFSNAAGFQLAIEHRAFFISRTTKISKGFKSSSLTDEGNLVTIIFWVENRWARH